ncbi:MAG: GTPase [Candidatus Hadarchaeum sp.]|uniref:NOG1 family protein n=1 Tax=Candidatus Hadarchaeum sp. TaxID=2883567 RepID=UPI00317A195F
MEKITLGKLPNVLTARELIDTAFKRASEGTARVEGSPREVAIQRERQRITIATTTIAEYLRKIVVDFPSLADLPPFYRDLVEAIEGIDELRKSLGAIGGTAKVVDKIRREQLRKLKMIKNPAEAAAVRRQAYGRISSVLKKIDRNLIFLKEAAKRLSDLPDVYLDLPTIVIAGYPNVGKSTLLKALTGSAPKIAPYPFTTTGLQLGYFEHGHQRYQVIDTPGLLDRPLEKRNKVELQAISALKHLAKSIVFILDPSESCGYRSKDQLNLLEDVRKSFPETKVFVVVNKTDLLNKEKIEEMRKVHPDVLFITATTGEGVSELKQKLI